ncbi:phage tail protein I [Veillonellaceae bacterium WCA-693-APC-5D-A]|uniref:Phage tail protein I n=1 Tax=Anaerovibrio slackiae TaxID=2652309 RepID=A0A6I2UKH8_9FIRM|nr:phage tail protein I [Anaerovibrio slackiae]MSU09216.1 phage tail protein I [Anaerovibrio slackiae]
MNNIEDYFIHKNLPQSLDKENVQEVAKVVDDTLLSFDKTIAEILIYPAIDMLGSELINTLAIQMHCDFYDDTLPLAVRRNLVKNSIAWHRIKGTPAAVEQMIQTVYQTGVVEEWFDYGGEPFFFKVNLGDSQITTQKIKNLIKMINASKNVRSWLEVLRFSKSIDITRYLGCFADVHKKYEIIPGIVQGGDISSSIFIGGHNEIHHSADVRLQHISGAEAQGNILLGGNLSGYGKVELLPRCVSDSDTFAKLPVGTGISSENYVCISPRSAINQDMICSFKTGIGEITYKAISLHKEENK